MLVKSDLDAPARLQYWPIVPDLYESARWEDARRFQTLREALQAALTEECPAGRAAYVLTASGITLKPDLLPEIWSGLQGAGRSNG
jgi:hypothetical protein